MSYVCKNSECTAPENKKGKEYPYAMECPFCDVHLTEIISLSESELKLINSLPYVIAYPLRKTLSEKHNWTKINLFKDTFLNYMKYLGLIIASEFFNSQLKDKRMVALFQSALSEPSFGSWNQYIRETIEYLKKENHIFFCPELVTHYENIVTKKGRKLYKGEIQYIDSNGDILLKKQEASAIGMLINFRNRYLGHGLTLDENSSQILWDQYFPIFKYLLDEMKFSENYPMFKHDHGETYLLNSADLRFVDKDTQSSGRVWLENVNGQSMNILPFFVVPGEVLISKEEKEQILAYESYTGKTIKFFSPEGTERHTSGKILEKLNLLLRDKLKEEPYTPITFSKDIFLSRIAEENKILSDSFISEKKIIPGVYQHREEIEIKLREWIGARANIFFIAAEAGSGKTNLLTEIQKQYTEMGQPTLLIRAGRMEKSSFKNQVAYLLNIDESFDLQMYTCIEGKQAAPTFILIDGLNEAQNAESIWLEIIDWCKEITVGSIKFVITSRANTSAELERYKLTEEDTYFLYGENDENEKGLASHVFWLTPMNMKEMKGAWQNYVGSDKGRFRPLFSFDDIATFDRGVYNQINNPLVLRLFLEIFNGKPLPKKGTKHVHIWQEWFKKFSIEEQSFLKILTDEVWLKGENDLLLDDLLKNEKITSYISSGLVNSPYARMKNMGWVSRYTKNLNAYMGFSVEGSMIYLLGKKLQQQIQEIDYEYIKSILLNGNKLQRSAIESFLCEQALSGNLELVVKLIDGENEFIKLCIQPLFIYLKAFGVEATVNKVLETPSENDWKVLLELDDKLDELQMHELRMNLLIQLMPHNLLKKRNELLLALKAIIIFDKNISLKYYNRIDSDLSFLKDDADLLHALGKCEIYFENYEKALDYYDKCKEIKKITFGEKHPSLAKSYHNIGITLNKKGEFDKALEYYNKCLDIELSTFGEGHHYVAMSYNSIGTVLKNKNDYEKALEYYEKSLNIKLKIIGGAHPSVARSYHNIGIIWDIKGDFDKALEYYNKSIAIELKTLGGEHPEVASSYTNIGSAWEDKGNYEKAIEYYDKCLAIELKTLGAEHTDVAFSYTNIGTAWKRKGDYNKALEYYVKCLAIQIKTMGVEHPDTASTYNNIGISLIKTGQLNKAFENLLTSSEIWKNSLGIENISTQSAINKTIEVAKEIGRENDLPGWFEEI